MAWSPISGTFIQYGEDDVDASSYYLKFYAAGTTTPIVMATDSTGGTTLDKCQLDTDGMPINGSGGDLIPHIDQKYKLVIYRNSTDADANTFASAYKEVDDIDPVITSVAAATVPVATIAAMTADTTAALGDYYQCADYDTGNNAGVLDFKIVAAGTGTADNQGALFDHDTLPLQCQRIFNSEIHVSEFGVLTDGTAQAPTQFQALIDYKGVAIFDGNVNLTGTVNLGTGQGIRGLSKTDVLQFSTLDSDGITYDADARNTIVSDCTISYTGTASTTNSGLKFNDTNGGEGHLAINVICNSFGNGLKAKEIWWGNHLSNVRFNSCGTSINIPGTGGQNIQNNFDSVYSNNPSIRGLYATACKGFTFTNCNFGMDAASSSTFGPYVYLASTCFGFAFRECNFENSGGATIPADQGGIEIRSSSTASLDNCTFVGNAGAAATANEIVVRDSAVVTISNHQEISQGANIRSFYSINTSKFVFLDNTRIGSGLVSLSTVPSVFLADPNIISGSSPTTGYATKFPDGTMICHGVTASMASGVLTMPQTFIDANWTISPSGSEASDVIVTAHTYTTTGVTLRIMDAAAATTSAKVNWTAIGRWK